MSMHRADREATGARRLLGRGVLTAVAALAMAGGPAVGMALAADKSSDPPYNGGDGNGDASGQYCDYKPGKYGDYCSGDPKCVDGEHYDNGKFCNNVEGDSQPSSKHGGGAGKPFGEDDGQPDDNRSHFEDGNSRNDDGDNQSDGGHRHNDNEDPNAASQDRNDGIMFQ